MIDRYRIEQLITAGLCAPSGDNSQPWSFRVEDETIRIFAHPEEDHAILNIEGRGTYLATGALLENIHIAAEHDGLRADFTLFPDASTTALVKLSPLSSRGHRLHDAIRERHTHRGPFTTHPGVPLDTLHDIRERHCHVRMITGRESIESIARAVSAMEEAALSTKKLHELFFQSIIWNADDNATGAPGLYIRTTELPPPAQALFRFIRFWPVQRVFNMLGFPRAAAAANAAVYARSSAIVAIVLDRMDREDLIAAGRCMQRVWLEVTNLGLYAQPLAGLLYLAEYLERTHDPDIAKSVVDRARSARATIEDIVESPHGSIAMLLRVGSAPARATARSARRAPRFV